ncbi:hypothetical protein ANANG_G00153160 [Anguilla anguilla]|uniref:Uncharacterized protein n=1 Tax=Anguilla anguilla TaxID=7936 RepID=A0A9D3MA25_ANGAN|nr:hypothetical protein ANANG_G00153160 [Anguilla anguilla]
MQTPNRKAPALINYKEPAGQSFRRGNKGAASPGSEPKPLASPVFAFVRLKQKRPPPANKSLRDVFIKDTVHTAPEIILGMIPYNFNTVPRIASSVIAGG